MSPLTKILSGDKKYDALTSAYDDMLNERKRTTAKTQAVTRGELRAILVTIEFFSLFPKTI